MIGKLQNKLKTMSRKLRDEAGATMVEMAIIVVLLFTVVTLIAQGGIVFMSWHAITNGAREGARYGATCLERIVKDHAEYTCDDDDVEQRVKDFTDGWLDKSSESFEVVATHTNTTVTVTITYKVPGIGPVIGEIPLSASSTMRLECPKR